ncbi:peptidase inhibitor family I36 protein [Streptomyces sp. NPDC032161]|uniref:peptidase inhibitor family I36 protein n=1 Tax=unclassified Streptomyces TaxID=2593676 RepID=UPI0033E40341
MSSVLVVAGLAAGALLSAPAAQAAVHDCPSGNYCVWTKPNHEGAWEKFSWNVDLVPPLVYKNDNSSFNRMSSYAMKLHSSPSRTSGSVYACSRPGTVWYQHNPAKQLASLSKVSTC